jgi:phosphatidylglycerol:prolipoprotein diacylglycerol transferase
LGILALGMSMGQWLCLPMIAVGVWLWVWSSKKNQGAPA